MGENSDSYLCKLLRFNRKLEGNSYDTVVRAPRPGGGERPIGAHKVERNVVWKTTHLWGLAIEALRSCSRLPPKRSIMSGNRSGSIAVLDRQPRLSTPLMSSLKV